VIAARRVGTGLAVSAVVVGILAIDLWTGTAWATCALIALLLAQAVRETCAMLETAGMPTHGRLAAGATLVLLLIRAAADPLGLSPAEGRTILYAGLAAAAVAPLVLGIARGPGEEGPRPSDLARAAATAFPLVWVTLAGSFLMELRLIPGTANHGVPLGLGLCLLVVAAVKVGDSAAYFVGKTMGRHKMCWASPKKSWEGALASVIASIAVAVLVGVWLGPDQRLMAGLGLVASLAGQGGDLVESYVKRAVGVKDSTTTFGELGGVLDMLDALLLAAPAAYLWVELLVVRGGIPA
jgi:phosphatidate cytidylyltransferase